LKLGESGAQGAFVFVFYGAFLMLWEKLNADEYYKFHINLDRFTLNGVQSKTKLSGSFVSNWSIRCQIFKFQVEYWGFRVF